MKAPFNLSSAIEKAILVAAFLPLVFVIYPETVAASYNNNDAQNSGGKALVFEVNSKQKTEQSTVLPISSVKDEEVTPVPQPTPAAAPKPVVHAKVVSFAQAAAPATTVSTYPGKTYSKDEVEQLIRQYAALYGINPQTAVCIAWHESGYNQFSKNKSSSASGVFQYLPSTWRGTDEGRAGLSVFDADANVRAAVKYMAIHRSTSPWTTRGSCPALTFTK